MQTSEGPGVGNGKVRHRQIAKRVVIRAAGKTLAGSHSYLSSCEAYQAPAIEPAGALDGMSGGSWRMLLLGGAAAGALSFAASRESHAAPDACVLTGGDTRTCTGNQSAGISYNLVGGLTTLNVNTLNQNITPALNTDGINFYGTGVATLTSNTTPFNITTTGNGRGIRVASQAAGKVTINHTGNITSNDNAIQAESQGGGVMVTVTGDITSTSQAGIYAADFPPGIGGVIVNVTGNITARNEGVSTYSNGGGATITTTGNLTSTNDQGIKATEQGNGTVRVTHTGDITSNRTGVYAYTNTGNITTVTSGNITAATQAGIYARADATSTINVTHNSGNVTGTAAQGIIARQDGTGTSTVTINGGVVTGATEGVRMFSDPNGTNILNNFALVTSAGIAVRGGGGNETINNSGIITGTINLGSGADAFNNLAGGTFNSGATVNIGAGNPLNNFGNLSPGGAGTIQTTAVTGDFFQYAGGTTTIDVNMAAMTNDLVTATGQSDLAGTVTLNLLNITTDTKTITVQTSAGGNTDNGLTLNAPAAVQGQLVVNANNVQVTFNVNFSAPGANLSPNQQTVADGLNTVFGLTGGGGPLGPLFQALAGLGDDAYRDVLEQLSAVPIGEFSFGGVLAVIEATNNALSCKQAAGMYAVVKEAECVWVRPGVRRFSQDRTDDSLGFTETAFGLSAGAQAALDRDKSWIVGLSAGYEHVDFAGNSGRSIITGDRFNGSAVIKYAPGPVLLAAGITGGYGTFDSARTISFTGFSGVAEGDFNSVFVNGRLRAAYLFEGPANNGQGQQADWYVKPQMDVDFIWSRRGGFTETGATGANLAIESESQFNAVFSPSVEFGAELGIGAAAARPFLKVGAQIFTNTESDVTARFAAAPGSPNFTTTSKTDRVFGTVSTGIDVVHEKALSLKLQYDGKFSGNSRSHAIGAKFSWRF